MSSKINERKMQLNNLNRIKHLCVPNDMYAKILNRIEGEKAKKMPKNATIVLVSLFVLVLLMNSITIYKYNRFNPQNEVVLFNDLANGLNLYNHE